MKIGSPFRVPFLAVLVLLCVFFASYGLFLDFWMCFMLLYRLRGIISSNLTGLLVLM